MTDQQKVWQPVQRHEYVGACRYTGYIARTIMLVLACGHENFRKASQGVPQKARCRQCEYDHYSANRSAKGATEENAS